MGEVLQFPTPQHVSDLERIFDQIIRAQRQRIETRSQRDEINEQRERLFKMWKNKE